MEQLLHYCWKHKLFPLKQLTTTDGQTVDVIDTGLHNADAGPDFLNAKVKIDDTVWVGNVEIHVKSSDWYAHRHEHDAAYNNVILHVADVIDTEVRTQDGRTVSQLHLSVPQKVSRQYERLLAIDAYPPCYEIIPHLSRLTVHSWMSALQSERLAQKTDRINERLRSCNGDWEATLFVTLARNYGFGINGDAFEQWALAIPLQHVAHHRDDLFQIEAFFMGQAGLLGLETAPQQHREAMAADDYFVCLCNEYQFLSRKFSLQPIDAKQWKFLRLRPQNFPYIRLAQLASLYHRQRFGLRNIVECETLDELRDMLRIGVTPYWETHYVFGAVSASTDKRLSEQTIDVLIINTVIPTLFAYGRYLLSERLCERALLWLEQLKAENNHIVKMWKACGLEAQNAGDSQALIQLKTAYCDRKECLRCRMGYEYLKGTAQPKQANENASTEHK